MNRMKRIVCSFAITAAISIVFILITLIGLLPFMSNFIEGLTLVFPNYIIPLICSVAIILIFIITYFIMGLRKDFSSQIELAVKNTRLEITKEYLSNIDIISWEQIYDSLEQRKKILIDELKTKYGRKSVSYSKLIESSVNENWKELENLFRAQKNAVKSNGKDKEIIEELDSVIDKSIDSDNEPELLELEEVDEGKTENKTGSGVSFSDDDYEFLEELEEPAVINPLEVLGELEEITDLEIFEENVDEADFDVVEQLEEVDENLEELEELIEFDEDEIEKNEPEVVDELAEPEAVIEAEEVEDAEEVGEAEEVIESNEVIEPEEIPESEDIVEPEEVIEAEEIEDSEEIGEAEEIEDVIEPEEIEEIDDIDDIEEIEEYEELEELDYRDPYPELIESLKNKPVYSADSNLTFISSLNDNFANVDNIFAEDLSIGCEYIQELNLVNTSFSFVPVKLEFVIDKKDIEEPLPVDSEACFTLTRFNENEQDSVELEEDSASTIVEVEGVYSIAEDLSYENVQQDQSFKALVNSVIGTIK